MFKHARLSNLLLPALGTTALLAVIACSPAAESAFLPEDKSPAQQGSGSTLGGAGSKDPSLEACETGATRSCCTTGKQTCGGGEFPSWGPCLDGKGEVASCSAPPAVPDAGTGTGTGTKDGGDAAPPVGSAGGSSGACTGACKAGAVRYCDTDAEDWSKQTCSAAGQWSACTPTTAPAGCGPTKTAKCCAEQKLCCQEDEEGPFTDNGGSCTAGLCK